METKTIYFECGMGAAGDMMMAGLLELLDGNGRDDFLKRLNGAGIPGVNVRVEPSVKHGITGTRTIVSIDGRVEADDFHHNNDNHHNGHHDSNNHHHDDNHNDGHLRDNARHDNNRHSNNHSHNDYAGIEQLINGLHIPETVKRNALETYKLLADAESRVHGVPVDKIHFHEVGDMDAMADIVGVCMLIDELSPVAILASPVNVGGGSARCAHGVMPVPAPAAACMLRGIPIYGDDSGGELCTPTGAALLKHFVHRFCNTMPMMSVDKIGYGMGKKDFGKANCLRVYIGNTVDINGIDNIDDINDRRMDKPCSHVINNANGIRPNDRIAELTCAIDDMTPEAAAFAAEALLSAGALDAYATPAVMKKGRAGLVLTCISRVSDVEIIVPLIFKHTTTLGIRECLVNRYTLDREQSIIQTKYGAVRIKNASGFGITKAKPEYDDIAAMAREHGVSISDVLKEAGAY